MQEFLTYYGYKSTIWVVFSFSQSFKQACEFLILVKFSLSICSFELILCMVRIRVKILLFFFFFGLRISSCPSIVCSKEYPPTTELSFYFCQKSVVFIFVSQFLDSLCSIDVCVNPLPEHTVLVPIAK